MNYTILKSGIFIDIDSKILEPVQHMRLRKESDHISMEFIGVNRTPLTISVGSTVDGQSFDNIDDLYDALKNFSNGGGTGEGVQRIIAGDNIIVDDSNPSQPRISASGGGGGGVPTLPNGQLIFGGPQGNVQRAISPSDLKTDSSTTGIRVIAFNAGTGLFQSSLSAMQNPTGNTLAQRTSTGQIKATGAINQDELITLGQLQSMTIEDDDLTEEQSNTTLNAKYPNAGRGVIVVAPNVGSGMFYIKLQSGSWFGGSGMSLS